MTVKFLEKPQTKDPEQTINAIKAATKDWEKVANIKFIWKERTDNAIIRIAFRPGGGESSRVSERSNRSRIATQGYNSLVGTTHLAPDVKDAQDEKTMNLDFRFFDRNNNPIPDDSSEIYGTTLHEFGHAIGCVHEQINPDTVGKLVWKPDAVYTWFSKPENQNPTWSKAKVDNNFNKFEPMPNDSVLHTKWDGTSIMQYFILKEWTSNLTADIPEPTKLSDYDKKFIGDMYPFPPK